MDYNCMFQRSNGVMCGLVVVMDGSAPEIDFGLCVVFSTRRVVCAFSYIKTPRILLFATKNSGCLKCFLLVLAGVSNSENSKRAEVSVMTSRCSH